MDAARPQRATRATPYCLDQRARRGYLRNPVRQQAPKSRRPQSQLGRFSKRPAWPARHRTPTTRPKQRSGQSTLGKVSPQAPCYRPGLTGISTGLDSTFALGLCFAGVCSAASTARSNRAHPSGSGSGGVSGDGSGMAVKRIRLQLVGSFRRTPSKVHSQAIRLHARHTGEIVIAWNALQSSLFMLFAGLFGDIHKQHFAHKIWHTIQSDKTQRELLLNAAEAIFGVRCPALLADIKWGLDRASQLSPYRNDAAHTAIWTVEQPTGKRAVFPDPRTSRSPSIQRLANTPTAAIWRKVRGDLYALSAYFDLIDAHARYGPLQPLRSRPAMQSIPTKTATPSRVRIQRGRARQPKA